MSRLMLSSDLHLGHRDTILKWRKGFSTAEEHHEILFDNLACGVNKSDSLILLGDVAITKKWLLRLGDIKCRKKTLILGNHDTELVPFHYLSLAYDEVHSLHSRRNVWFSHCPIHPQELRGRVLNIHGHTHSSNVVRPEPEALGSDDIRYVNVCVEKTNWKPVSFAEATRGLL